MTRSIITICAAALALSITAQATADIVNYTVAPSDLVDQATFGTGGPGTGFGWDWDEDRPIGANSPGSGAPGYGPTSFYSDVQGSAAGGPRDYTALRLSPATIFGSAVTLGDIGLSYWTSLVSDFDWQIKIYTEKANPSDPGWYGHRFNFERPDDPGTGWNNYGTDDLNVEWIRSGSGTSTYPNALLSTLLGTYGTENIMFIDIIASYATNSPPSHSYLDGVELMAGGDAANVNLIPAPGAVFLGMMGLGMVGWVRRRFA